MNLRLLAAVCGVVFAACVHRPPDSGVEPIRAFDCTARYPSGDPYGRVTYVQADGATQINARTVGEALAKLESDVRQSWNREWRGRHLSQRAPPFPGLQDASCAAASAPETGNPR